MQTTLAQIALIASTRLELPHLALSRCTNPEDSATDTEGRGAGVSAGTGFRNR